MHCSEKWRKRQRHHFNQHANIKKRRHLPVALYFFRDCSGLLFPSPADRRQKLKTRTAAKHVWNFDVHVEQRPRNRRSDNVGKAHERIVHSCRKALLISGHFRNEGIDRRAKDGCQHKEDDRRAEHKPVRSGQRANDERRSLSRSMCCSSDAFRRSGS